jgi:hypothetical protein
MAYDAKGHTQAFHLLLLRGELGTGPRGASAYIDDGGTLVNNLTGTSRHLSLILHTAVSIE